MKRFYKIDMYNVNIIIKACGESEIYNMECFRKVIESEPVSAEDICKWCINHNLIYGVKFKPYKYRKDSIRNNIIGFIKYRKIRKLKKNTCADKMYMV